MTRPLRKCRMVMPGRVMAVPLAGTPMNSFMCRPDMVNRTAATSPSHGTSWNSSLGRQNALLNAVDAPGT